MKSNKIILCGSAGCGKTTFTSLLMNERFRKYYVATLGVEVHPITISSTSFLLWDCAGEFKFGGLRDGYWIGSTHAIIMCDASDENSINEAITYHKQLISFFGKQFPIALVVNKMDLNPTFKFSGLSIGKVYCSLKKTKNFGGIVTNILKRINIKIYKE